MTMMVKVIIITKVVSRLPRHQRVTCRAWCQADTTTGPLWPPPPHGAGPTSPSLSSKGCLSLTVLHRESNGIFGRQSPIQYLSHQITSCATTYDSLGV